MEAFKIRILARPGTYSCYRKRDIAHTSLMGNVHWPSFNGLEIILSTHVIYKTTDEIIICNNNNKKHISVLKQETQKLKQQEEIVKGDSSRGNIIEEELQSTKNQVSAPAKAQYLCYLYQYFCSVWYPVRQNHCFLSIVLSRPRNIVFPRLPSRNWMIERESYKWFVWN